MSKPSSGSNKEVTNTVPFDNPSDRPCFPEATEALLAPAFASWVGLANTAICIDMCVGLDKIIDIYKHTVNTRRF